MKTDKYTCDNCGKIALEHPYDEEGWLIVHGTVTLTHGRATNRNAVTGFLHPTDEAHFCSMKCFWKYMSRIKPDGKLRKLK